MEPGMPSGVPDRCRLWELGGGKVNVRVRNTEDTLREADRHRMRGREEEAERQRMD